MRRSHLYSEPMTDVNNGPDPKREALALIQSTKESTQYARNDIGTANSVLDALSSLTAAVEALAQVVGVQAKE